MTTKEIYFEVILPKSSFLNYRLGITKTVLPDETVIDVCNKACQEAEEWHKSKHPELYKHNDKPLTTEETELVQEIESADTPHKLGMLKGRITNATKPYYMDKLKTLTNNFQSA